MPRVSVEGAGSAAATDTAPAPLSPRQAPAVAISDDAILVFSGFGEDRKTLSDGATFGSEAGKWHAVGASPFPSGLVEPAAVATADGGIVVVGLPCLRAAAEVEGAPCETAELVAAEYSPAENRWEELSAPTAAAASAKAVGGASPIGWIGSQAVFEVAVPPGPTILAYQPERRSWEQIPPVAGIIEPYCATSGGLVGVGGQDVSSQDPPASGSGTNTHVYRDGKWLSAENEPAALADQTASRVVCGDDSVVFLPWHKSLQAGPTWWMDTATSRWIAAPQLDIPAGRHVSVATLGDGTRAIAFAADGQLQIHTWRPGGSRWTTTTVAGDDGSTIRAMGADLVVEPSDPVASGFRILSSRGTAP